MNQSKVSLDSGAVESPDIIRELGCMEIMMKLLHDESMGILSNALWLVSKEQLTENLLRKALNRLARKVPQLRLRIQHKEDNKSGTKTLYFAEIKDFQMDSEVLDTTDWISVISEEWLKPFNCETGPLWRVKFIPKVALGKKDHTFQHEYVIIFSNCHAILDGMSYQTVFGYLLDCLEDTRGNKIENPISMEILPPLEDVVHLRQTNFGKFLAWIMEQILKRATGRKLMRLLTSGGKHPYFDSTAAAIEEDPTVPQVSSLVPLEFTQEETSNIVRACRARNTTVNGALHAAAFLAFMRFLPGKSPKKVKTSCPVNLRRHLSDLKDHKQDSLGVFVSLCEIKLNPNPILEETSDVFWALVKDTNKQIKKSIETLAYAKDLKYMSIFMSAIQRADLKIGDLLINEDHYGREGCFLLTNMGKCDYLTRSENCYFKLAGRYGGSSDQRFGAILTHNLNTFNDRIYWTIIYSKHIIKTEKVEECGKWIREILHKFCGDTAV